MPQVGHYACKHHAGNEEEGSQQQELADTIPVAKEPYVRTNQPQDYPLEAESKADRAVAPAEPRRGVAQMRHQGRRREPH